MPDYKILKRQIFSSGNYKIVPIRYEDRMLIMKWRNEQIYHLRQSKPLTESDQENYFANVVSKLFTRERPEQILFSYLENEECIGYGGLVHINWLDQHAEISFVINSELEKKDFHKHWGIFLDLIERVAFDELNLHKLFTYAFDLRPHLYEAVETKGYKKEAVLREHCLFKGNFIDVIIHSKTNSGFSLREATSQDCFMFFEWANDEGVRRNSFNPQKIELENHIAWFNKKLSSDQSKLYVLLKHETPVGQARLDKEGDYWNLDYSIDSKYRGNGLGNIIVKALIETYVRPLKAVVKKSNIASIKVFQNNGFQQEDGHLNQENVYFFLLK